MWDSTGRQKNTVDMKSLHTPAQMPGFHDVKKNGSKVNNLAICNSIDKQSKTFKEEKYIK